MANNIAPGYPGTVTEETYVVHFAKQATAYFFISAMSNRIQHLSAVCGASCKILWNFVEGI